ncbi:MAG: ComEA family DNA-binding protein [Atopobiaceae bacterium]
MRLERLLQRCGLMHSWQVIVAAALVLLAVGLLAFVLLGAQGSNVVLKRSSDAIQEESVQADTGSNESADKIEEASASETSSDSAEEAYVVVDVGGCVTSPGVVTLTGEKPRVHDAIAAAGGLAEGADTARLNLAAPVSDGEKVYVPRVGEEADGASATSATSASSSGASSASASPSRVNINTASAAELQNLPGVGPSTAESIVKDREQNGPFSSVDDLMRVSGIGEKKLGKMREYAYV